MKSKTRVAEEIVEFCKKRQGELRLGMSSGGGPRVVDDEAINQFQGIREAFENVIAAAAASQTPPVDFKQGEPGIAECKCEACEFAQFKQLRALRVQYKPVAPTLGIGGEEGPTT